MGLTEKDFRKFEKDVKEMEKYEQWSALASKLASIRVTDPEANVQLKPGTWEKLQENL